MPVTDPEFQASQEGGQGQHGAVPVAHTPAAADAGTRATMEVLEGLDGQPRVRHEGGHRDPECDFDNQ